MSTADAPLARICSRQTCRRPAQATLTFVYSDSTAVIGPLSVHAEPHAYDLCIPHARRMTPPRGWEIVRLEGVVDADDPDPAGSGPKGTVADSAPLAPLSALPGAATGASGPGAGSMGGSGGPEETVPSEDDAAEGEAPDPEAAAAQRSGGRRGRLRAVTAPPAEAAPGDLPAPAEAQEDAPEEAEQTSDGLGSLSDEIFAGEDTELVRARSRARGQPRAMRRPHLRRGRG